MLTLGRFGLVRGCCAAGLAVTLGLLMWLREFWAGAHGSGQGPTTQPKTCV